MKEHCDLETGQIYGCKEGSLKWWHEKGHLEFNSSKNMSFLVLLQHFALELMIPFVLGAFIWRLSLTIAILLYSVHIGLYLYEEWWCNEYSKKKYKEVKDGLD
jgi:hypothetical protein